MFCPKCGKEIDNQARFCNYCGCQMTPSTSASQASSQPQAPSQPQTPPAQPKKSGKGKKFIVTLLVVAISYTASKYFTEKAILSSKQSSSPSSGTEIAVTIPDENHEDLSDAMDKCLYGAVYQNDYLRYGPTRLHVPGYYLYPGENGESDWLMNTNGGCLVGAYRQLEISSSYNSSTREGMLKSWQRTYSNAVMNTYQKYYVNNVPVIRYIVEYTTEEGQSLIQGELVVFPTETTDKTVRLTAVADAAYGYNAGSINQIFDTLEISSAFAPTIDETGVMDLQSITVK